MFDPGPGFLNSQRAFPNFIDYPSLKRMSLEGRFLLHTGTKKVRYNVPGAFPEV
jgi:hypothetical protein